jgi:hypothetical protein
MMPSFRILKIPAFVAALLLLLNTRAYSQTGTKLEPSGAISPSVSWVTSTQNQTLMGGSALISGVKSRSYCDVRTRQVGVVGSASDSITSSTGTTSTVLASNDIRADGLFGFAGNKTDNANREHIDTTKNYFSVDADFFMNNSVGIGLQQQYAANYTRYIRACSSVQGSQRFFASLSVGAGFVDERLYATTNRLNSMVIPVSGQFSYILTNPKQPPKLIFSLQGGYAPLPNDPHAYQADINASLQIPTRWPALTLAINEMDFYMNNAPTGFRRNYQSGSFQLTVSFGGSTNTPPAAAGACYTADTLNHLYCYDQIAASECSPPSVFRPNARCSAAAEGPEATPAPDKQW